MPVTTRTFDVTAAPAACLAYLADFGHAEAWDPGTVTCTRVGDGPIAVGARWHNVSRIAGISTELDYRLTAWDEGRVELVGTNKTASSTEDIRCVPQGTGTRVTYRSVIVFHGLAKLADPLSRLVFRGLGDRTRDGLVRVLDRLA